MRTLRHLIMFSTPSRERFWIHILCSLPSKKKRTCLITVLPPDFLCTPLAWKSFQHFQSPSNCFFWSWEILLLTFGTPKEQPTVRQQETHQITKPLTSTSEQSVKLFFLSAVFESPFFQVPLNQAYKIHCIWISTRSLLRLFYSSIC